MNKKTDSNHNTNSETLGYDSLLEDLFGLNIRGLKTIWTLICRPHEYFIAAKSHNWQDKFTPSFRVWFAIMAIGTACTFIWAGTNSPMLGAYTEIMSQVATGANVSLAEKGKMLDPAGFDARTSAKALVKWTQLVLPFAYFILFILLAAIYRAWGEKLSFVVRLRYVFAIIIPGSIIGYIFAMSTTWVPQDIFQLVNYGGMFLMFLSYFYVAYFGPYRNVTGPARAGRSLAITALIIVAVMLASIISVMGAFFPAVKSTFPDAIELVKNVTTAP